MERVEHGHLRPNWKEIVEKQEGLIFNESALPNGEKVSYWSEDRSYHFSTREISELYTACDNLLVLMNEAGDYIINNNLMGRLGIPEHAWSEIIRTWKEEPPSIYGRFDIRYGGELPSDDFTLMQPKLLEFNADTPTSLIEASVIQWNWLKQARPQHDQWNHIHETLVDAWPRLVEKYANITGRKPDVVHFAYDSSEQTGEDAMTATYLMSTALEAGLKTVELHMQEIEWDRTDGRYYDHKGRPLDFVFKLFPWENLMMDDASAATTCVRNMSRKDGRGTMWVEPIYKMLWSNKGILPILWTLFGNDSTFGKYLLPAYFEDEKPESLRNFVRKPMLGREGADTTIYIDNKPKHRGTEKGYGEEGFIVQEFAPLPEFRDSRGIAHYPVLGPWMLEGTMGSEALGMGIREARDLITGNDSFFVPHTCESLY